MLGHQQESLSNFKVINPISESNQNSPEILLQKEIRAQSFPKSLKKLGTLSSLDPLATSSNARNSKQVEISLNFSQSIRASRQLSQAIQTLPKNQEKLTEQRSNIKVSLNKIEENKEKIDLNIEKVRSISSVTEVMSDKQVIGSIETLEDEKNLIEEEKKEAQPRKISLKVLKSQTEIFYFNFIEALKEYEDRPVGYIDGCFWIETWRERWCCCFKAHEKISQEFYASCEKVVIFAYSKFDFTDVFCCSLVKSVYRRLEELLEVKDDLVAIGFSSENPHLNDLKHNVTNLGLLLNLFLTEYIPSAVKNMIVYCRKCGIGFIRLAFDIAEITIHALRRKKLNRLINQSQKCLEVVFFVYCGCLAHWFILHEECNQDLSSLTSTLKISVLDDPNTFIELTKKLIEAEAE